jgi:hypothetical protein
MLLNRALQRPRVVGVKFKSLRAYVVSLEVVSGSGGRNPPVTSKATEGQHSWDISTDRCKTDCTKDGIALAAFPLGE